MDAEDIAEIYLRHFAAKHQDDEWAVTEVDDLVRRDPIGGWDVTRELVRKAESDEALAYVAAGPLEELLVNHGAVVIDLIERECLGNERLRLALSGVWLDREDPIWERWYKLMWKYGFAEGSQRPL
jgi:hypothetical protein